VSVFNKRVISWDGIVVKVELLEGNTDPEEGYWDLIKNTFYY
jgi:hypothetical protein